MKKYSRLLFISLLISFFSVACMQTKGKAVEEGMPAPNFTLPDLNQNTVTLSNYKDKKPVLLFFWTSWCPFCRQDLKMLNDKSAELKNDGIELLAINVGEPQDKVNRFIQGYILNLTILLDETSSVATDYGLVGVPTYYLINKQGNIIYEGHTLPDYRGLTQ